MARLTVARAAAALWIVLFAGSLLVLNTIRGLPGESMAGGPTIVMFALLQLAALGCAILARLAAPRDAAVLRRGPVAISAAMLAIILAMLVATLITH